MFVITENIVKIPVWHSLLQTDETVFSWFVEEARRNWPGWATHSTKLCGKITGAVFKFK